MSNNITRISIFRPEYIIHDNQKWILSSNERKNLIMLLKYTVKDKDKTIWQIILEQCVAESNMYDKHLTKEDESKILTTEIPDYTKLK